VRVEKKHAVNGIGVVLEIGVEDNISGGDKRVFSVRPGVVDHPHGVGIVGRNVIQKNTGATTFAISNGKGVKAITDKLSKGVGQRS
jgi:hypothetical protein